MSVVKVYDAGLLLSQEISTECYGAASEVASAEIWGGQLEHFCPQFPAFLQYTWVKGEKYGMMGRNGFSLERSSEKYFSRMVFCTDLNSVQISIGNCCRLLSAAAAQCTVSTPPPTLPELPVHLVGREIAVTQLLLLQPKFLNCKQKTSYWLLALQCCENIKSEPVRANSIKISRCNRVKEKG